MTKEIKLQYGVSTLVDDDDYEMLSRYKWVILKDNKRPKALLRVWGRVNGRFQYLHRFIMNAPSGMQIDHINGNSLDNRKQNLRLATVQENCFNRPKRSDAYKSKYKGVEGNRSSWVAEIKVSGKRIGLGSFKTEIEAAVAYNEAAKKYFGEFARLNVIDE